MLYLELYSHHGLHEKSVEGAQVRTSRYSCNFLILFQSLCKYNFVRPVTQIW